MTVEPTSTRANRTNSDRLDWSYTGFSVLWWGIRRALSIFVGVTRRSAPEAYEKQWHIPPRREHSGLESFSEARAMACVSIYSRIFATLPFCTVIAKTQLSLNGLFAALTFPVAEPMTMTRSP